jgi:hypothetical protein
MPLYTELEHWIDQDPAQIISLFKSAKVSLEIEVQ